MIYREEFSEILTKTLKKIKKKNKVLFDITISKIKEIIADPERYKNLRYDLKGLKRVHLFKSFVLVFKVDERNKIVRFEKLDHHDNIYRR